jgi:prophage regulatory protein
MVRRFIRFKAVKETTGLAKSSIYALIDSGEFPKPIPLGKRSVAWLEDEVAAWQKARIALRDAASFHRKAA